MVVVEIVCVVFIEMCLMFGVLCDDDLLLLLVLVYFVLFVDMVEVV